MATKESDVGENSETIINNDGNANDREEESNDIEDDLNATDLINN